MPEGIQDSIDAVTATPSQGSCAAVPVGACADSAEHTLPGSVLMLGIGGMGMAPLAIYLAQAGVHVCGCDDHLQPRVRALLEAAGVVLCEPSALPEVFASGELDHVRLCAISSAIGSGHTLLALARSHGMRIVRRGELLAAVSRTRKLLAVVGSHGKTTTTGLIIEALTRLGFDFDYVLGGLFQEAGRLPASHSGTAQWLVAEVDESDGTIDHFSPEVTVAVNFDWDHADRYGSAAALRDTFGALFARTATSIIFPSDDAVLAALVPEGKAQPCAAAASAAVKGFNGCNEALARAAATVLTQDTTAVAGISFTAFGGIFRRQEWLYRSPALSVMTDYAHHPREVAALLAYLRVLRPEAKLVAVFQPHRFTRTRQFAAEFARVLKEGADAFLLMPVYAASEAAFEEGRSEAIAAACNALRVQNHRMAEAGVAGATGRQPLSGSVEDSGDGAPAASPAIVSVSAAHAIAGQCREYLNAGRANSVKAEDELAGATLAEHAPRSAQAVCIAATQADTVPAIENRHANSGIAAAAAGQGVTLVFVGAGDIDVLARNIAADCALRDHWATQLDGETVLRLGEPLARRTTMRIGGNARFYAEPATHGDLVTLLRLAREAALPVWLLGGGSNLIVPDEGFDGLVIGFKGEAFRVIEPRGDGSWYVGSGVALRRLCAQAAREGLAGWEFLDGIPGTVGGALRMNAGAMGKWMFDVVEAVDVLEKDGTITRRHKDEFTIEYRRCHEIADGAVALGALLRPDLQVTAQAVRETLDTYASRRRETQPREPSAGCIFKNPTGDHAGALIDRLGLKGLRIGGAEVSAVHGNFIVNRDNATAADVIELVRQVRARVREATGIELEPEAILLGTSWHDVLQQSF